MSLSLEVGLDLTTELQRVDCDDPQKPVCKLCGSDQVTFDASAWWDYPSQSFEYDIADGDAFCLGCSQKQSVKWVPV